LTTHFQLNETPETLVQLKRKHFKYLFEHDKELTLIDGALDRIKDYHDNDLKLVVASSASMPNINRIFERFDLNPYFIGKFSGADLKASKPHPEIFIKAAQHTAFSKSECMVIEDSTNGIKAARLAGLFCVGFKSIHSTGQDYSLADIVVSNFDEICYSRIKMYFQ
jgi:HAD superfamily hydrolase (TIGR01509 family)